jgi:hypothetical protein
VKRERRKKRKTERSLRGPGGVLLRLDTAEVFPDDPGSGTPAIVELPFGGGSATYDAALGGAADFELTERQVRWLDEQETEVLKTWADGGDAVARETLAKLASGKE